MTRQPLLCSYAMVFLNVYLFISFSLSLSLSQKFWKETTIYRLPPTSSSEISIIQGGGREREREREIIRFHGSVDPCRWLLYNSFVSGEGVITRVGPQLSNRNNGYAKAGTVSWTCSNLHLSVDNGGHALTSLDPFFFVGIFPPIIDSLLKVCRENVNFCSPLCWQFLPSSKGSCYKHSFSYSLFK